VSREDVRENAALSCRTGDLSGKGLPGLSHRYGRSMPAYTAEPEVLHTSRAMMPGSEASA